ncbi:MAG: PHP domain-containing protein [Firmicutes bacterium]|nr:PHP domain-containing protein [Bacillota bacterium]
MNVEKVDLHMHSNASDGLLSPNELSLRAAEAGLAAFALTDHDTLDGLAKAAAAAKNYNIEFVPGVEISTEIEGREVHILGYYPLNKNDLNAALNDMKSERHVRMNKMLEALHKLGFKIKMEDILLESGSAAPGRLHLARLLLKKKYVHSLDEAFSVYLGRDKPAYVPRNYVQVEDVLNLLKNSGAVPVLAHPGVDGKYSLKKLVVLGLKGIEVFHPDHSPNLVRIYRQAAENMGLVITGGSDYHGGELTPSSYSGKFAVEKYYLNRLKECAGIT